ncbi:sialate O-acetylesterase [Flammeovirga agarivorans]|uniref:Sialate O-acetylesterase n=1 Tax=Flammeovirga agarivorans TaxID=2726742 RepID=A0A7X8SGE2_9BACT|nr:sialate O-acetylesterase [Flammeovirga agarivorans]NLR89743.1 sialate O-acetylesterase [Flammeovirga agarivorans]
MKNTFLSFLIIITSALYIKAQTRVGSPFTDHMVLQQNEEVNLWGWDTPAAKLTVKGSWGESVKTIVDQSGKWKVTLKTPEGSYTNYQITIKGTSTIKLSDVLFGEVWLCSGQSNMQMPLQGYYGQPVIGSREMIASSNQKNYIRLFQVKRAFNGVVQDTLSGKWTEATPSTVRAFSAVAYSFGKKLAENLNVPIGLIHSSQGGSKAEAWMSESMYRELSDDEIVYEGINQKKAIKTPTLYYNAMIHPLVGYTIRGAIWYQGEANRSTNATQKYSKVQSTLINGWRTLWNQGDFPFYFVEIAPFGYNGKDNVEAAELRAEQYLTTELVKNTAMVSTADLGDLKYIHPSQKIEVGNRLANIALSKNYGIEGLDYLSPIYKSSTVKGKYVSVQFDDAPTGITTYSKELKGFELAGEDGKFYPAKGKFKKYRLSVFSDSVSHPKYIRYAFKNYHEGNLFSVNGLPVIPFNKEIDKKVE